MTANKLLEIRNLHVHGFSDGSWHQILKGVDLDLAKGEILGLVGESGAGKSTLGLSALGHFRHGCRPTSGSVKFDGIELLHASDRELNDLRGRRIAYVAQSAAASFNPAKNLNTQIIEPCLLHGTASRSEAMELARALFERLKLPDPATFGQRFPHQVSGGQLQRAMTAMAMATKPDLIVFDEPTTALDVTTQVEVLAAIRDAVRINGTAALYITHDLAVVAQMADRVKVLRYGLTVEENAVREIISNPQDPYTKTLWSVKNMFKQPSQSSDALLELVNVNAHYGAVRALTDVSFSVPIGKTVAVVGESGSGKSTTARVVAGLHPATSGVVRFAGDVLLPRLEQRSRRGLQDIQFIHQMADTAMNPKHSVMELIGRPLQHFKGLSGAALKDQVCQLLDVIGLSDSLLLRKPGELSGGQKQRICIARALAAEPRLLICDEITSALDKVVQKNILDLLQQIQSTMGLSILFITHDIDTVEAIADDVVVMQRGRIVDSGLRDQVLSPPFAEYTGLLMEAVPKMDPDWLNTYLLARSATEPRRIPE